MTVKLLDHLAEGPASAPPLLLGPSLGTSYALWDAVAPELSAGHRVVRWNLPGHGGSAPDLIGPGATVGDLAALVLALADGLGIDRFGYAGVSLSGAVGLHLAVHHPDRLTSLAVMCSAARFGGEAPWRERAERVRHEGVEWLAASADARWFTPGFTVPGLVRDHREADPRAYAACCDALAAFDLRDRLGDIAVPTLLVAGKEDPSTPPARLREIADAVPRATLVELPGCSHLAPAQCPRAVLTALRAQLDGPPASGTAVRREVLGDAHVDRAQARQTPFTARFQDFISRYAWGEIWTDPTLSRRERSMITLTALVAHGHTDELAMHVRAALRNGLTPPEIAAVLLQTAVYCGVPAANSAFATAQRVLDELAENAENDEGAGEGDGEGDGACRGRG
ncbi:bifunctional 3-oxoadipate enol-lactonase/4-carboxymuconolactone decarboxylase PcaDC [Streptomyces alanosinicus]|uniref:3-oxoadipate enol-lactonase n=1 Tax=Streptomyces alanosinicus TaxID=68171 RepID=A0A918YJ21_9ACTN|nr:4-carboxymuconolactone decarboxylase [Streptomyces alanosinicus]GHE05772.1 3-oxoadipate enol-lactonase [Streptomyces alanosinicus]